MISLSTYKLKQRSGYGVGCLLVTALGLRIWGAYAFRYITDPDCSVVGLMARHMAEGRRFPVFFYGQSYMGSLEPMVSALLVLLFGANGFVVCLAPALVATLALWMWYVYARDAGGRGTAVVALGLCVIGPACYFMFQFAPRGGYMVALFFSGYILRSSSRISAQLWQGESVSDHHFIRLGLAVGLALWSHLISISAIFSAIFLLLAGMKGRIWRYPSAVFAGFTATMAGLALWLLFNVQNHWDSLKMAQYLTCRPLGAGLGLLKSRWIFMIEFEDTPSRLTMAACAGYVLLIAAGLVKLIRDLSSGHRDIFKCFAWAGLFGFLGISTLLFVYSEYADMHTARYLIPMVPALAVLAGYAFSEGGSLRFRLVPELLLGFLLFSQLPVLKSVYRQAAAVPEKFEGQQEILRALNSSGAEAFYAERKHYFLNFMTAEAYPFAPGEAVFLETNTAKVEFAENPGVFKNYCGLDAFLRLTGGSAQETPFDGGSVHAYFQAPPASGRIISPSHIQSVKINGVESPLLSDRDIATGTGYGAGRETVTVSMRFREPTVVVKGRFQLNDSTHRGAGSFADSFTCAVQYPGETVWSPLYEAQSIPAFFWSGPRPYYNGRRHRLEMRLPGKAVNAIRFEFRRPAGHQYTDLEILEMEFFSPAVGDQQSEADALPELLNTLNTLPLKRIYADRWVSNQLYRSLSGELAVELYPATKLNGGLPSVGAVIWDTPSGFLIHHADLPATLEVLAQAGCEAEQIAVGPWTLLVPVPSATGDRTLYWTGYGLRFRGEGLIVDFNHT